MTSGDAVMPPWSGEGSGSAGLRGLPRPVAVVIGGGGVFGAAQVGVGYALQRCGFVPDLIVGTSVGALNGATAAAHPGEAAPWLARVWTHARRREVFPLGYLPARDSVFADRGLRRLIAHAGLPSLIEQLRVPFTAVAMDLATGEEVLLDHGDLASALLASTAIPGILPPVDREGRTLIDGGVVAFVPVRAALRAGAASLVVVSTGPESRTPPPVTPPWRAAAVAARAGLLLLRHQIERDLCEVSRQVPTVVVPNGVEAWPAPWDFGHAQRLIDTAASEAGHFLDGLRVSGPGLYRADGPLESAQQVADLADEADEKGRLLSQGALEQGPRVSAEQSMGVGGR
ncbi:patatin [Sphaerisporangium melleum]|uniref:Patatin n=1 Tax=Sphaerisporangium melleum TaxID=321316 RepID=A0A917RDE1_9ACTN|nr:patatin-like phospholipase family protein [Sphaerisporangium melleum]GGL03039.1 patatin [Sphaerisporangium melleum]GII69447.1 patatin [Sphaerisporangium melleum]